MERPQNHLYGYDPFPDLFEKASILIQSIIRFHPFIDGNKITTIMAVEMFLEENGYHLVRNIDDVVEFIMKIEAEGVSIADCFLA